MALSENRTASGINLPDFETLLAALTRPEAFPFALAGEDISLRQTHASAVVLAQERAYKLKKPKNFGFFDYSTPALRRHFCVEEVRLNARLAPDVYLGVAPVLQSSAGPIRFGPTFSAKNLPKPGDMLDNSLVIDYAVVMLRLPDKATLEAQVRAGTATPALLAEVARSIAAFHRNAKTGAHIASFGERQVIEGNWQENFAQIEPYIGRTLDAARSTCISTAVQCFLDAREPLFASRVREGRIRDCHGDLRLQHVYIPNPLHEQLAVIDCIEFNERFRYGDVAAEIAFLLMELDAAGRPDLSRAFLAAYLEETDDEALCEMLPFYLCYRAYVRGKVESFQLDEPEVSAAQREAALERARLLFALAGQYAESLSSSLLVLVGGVMGTGKSTLAQALQREVGWASCSSDTIRKHLAGLQPAQPQEATFGAGIYSADWTARTYQRLLEAAQAALVAGRSVIVDASFSRRADRLAMARLAAKYKARAVFVECTCSPEVALDRLARRWAERVAGQPESMPQVALASDGRPALYEAQRAAWEHSSDEEDRTIEHLEVDTARPLAVEVEQVIEALRLPRSVCWLESASNAM
jgi:aminoglycoside phosphotransferase family enzyme/predicted kinase